jgi:hypothetical protein
VSQANFCIAPLARPDLDAANEETIRRSVHRDYVVCLESSITGERPKS